MNTISKLRKLPLKMELVYQFRKSRLSLLEWNLKRNPLPPPPYLKHQVIKNYAKRFKLNILIETGTYLGDVANSTKSIFKRIYTIELGKSLYKRARKRFLKYPHIEVIGGDSAKVLPKLIKNLREPCLFWLDAHYSSGNTVRGEIETPIINELKTILKHPIKKHVILIDDALDFRGYKDYPTIQELKEFVKNHSLSDIKIKNNIIRIIPKKLNK